MTNGDPEPQDEDQKRASNRSGSRLSTLDSQLIEQVAKKEQRKMKARREQDRGIWYGLGMFGLVGWSIAVPTLIGIAIGIWIDRTWQHKFSCTLMCLFVGVVIGCSMAWYWVKHESLTAMNSDDHELSNEADGESRGSQE